MIRLLLFLSLLLLPLPAMAQQEMPANAVPRLSNGGWECLYGYRRIADRCEAIPVPMNASLTIDGRGWRCDRGYQQDGRQDACIAVSIPENATMRLQGTAWQCEYGFVRQGNICRKLAVPANAILSVNGRDWQCMAGFIRSNGRCLHPDDTATGRAGADSAGCKRGYRRQNNICVRFFVPDNAAYTPDGNDWICMPGFWRDGDTCRKPTVEEKQREQQSRELYDTIQAMQITPDGSEPFSLAEFSRECRVVNQSGVYGRFECAGDRLAMVESGCFSVMSRTGGIADIRCPSPVLAPIAKYCIAERSGDDSLPVSCGNLAAGPAD